MLLLTLIGSLAAFWGFFGWFSEHKETVLRWVALAISMTNLLFCGQIYHRYSADGWDASSTLLIGGIGLYLCYRKEGNQR